MFPYNSIKGNHKVSQSLPTSFWYDGVMHNPYHNGAYLRGNKPRWRNEECGRKICGKATPGMPSCRLMTARLRTLHVESEQSLFVMTCEHCTSPTGYLRYQQVLAGAEDRRDTRLTLGWKSRVFSTTISL